jgi:hypothetical protein
MAASCYFVQVKPWQIGILAVVASVVGLILGLLAAIVPYKQRSFNERFIMTLPVMLSLALILQCMIAFYSAYMRQADGISFSKQRYDDIEIPPGLDCSSVRNGRFETESMSLDLNGKTQVQTVKLVGYKLNYTVLWRNDCEYELISGTDAESAMCVKITAVREDGYECCYIYKDQKEEEYPAKVFMKRITEK